MNLLINSVFAIIMAFIMAIVGMKLYYKWSLKKLIKNAPKKIKDQEQDGYKFKIEKEEVKIKV